MKRRVFMVLVVSALVIVSAGVAPAAQWANPDLLVSADALENDLGKPDWIVVDCRKLEEYAKGHIPGAISFGKNCKKALRDGTSRTFRDISKYDKILSKVGISNNSHVVFYGELKSKSMDDATVAFWVMEYLGHTKTHVLNGGLEGWVSSGKKLEQNPSMKQPATYKAKAVHNRFATTDEMLKFAKGQAKGVQVIDARTKHEYEGTDIRAVKGGHIPHVTINIDHNSTYDQKKDPKTGKDTATSFLSPDHVMEFYKSLDKNKRTIAYCQTGSRSCLTYMELRLMGFKDPANWDDSWIVWGDDLTKKYPIENEEWLDFSRIDKLEKAVKKLEEKLKAAEEKH
jgi:thiosulfate/3-mercaptopyruvate sulfurtransferase